MFVSEVAALRLWGFLIWGIQVGSHYHFIETNPLLEFDRIQSCGFRLDIAAGTAVRFEPGDTKSVTLVEIGGRKIIEGGNSIATGQVNALSVDNILKKLEKDAFAHLPVPESSSEPNPAPFTLDRGVYATMFGPTVGDLVKLGDTELWVKVEKDYTVYGDECKFGGGKTVREGMGQACGRLDKDVVDLVITNALVVDYTGIYKV